MDEKNNNEESYKLVKLTEDKKFWGRVGDWFKDLFKGFWYGITDLFLVSWAHIVLFIFLLFVPLAYAIVCALGYWDPVSNLGKVELPIFDADRTFIKVEDKSNKDAYHIGALEEIENKDGKKVEVTDDVAEQIAKNKYDFSGVKEYILNNGFVVSKDNATITPMNTWDALKSSGLLKKDKPNKDDEDSKFEMTISPNEELHFRNIRYINDKNDDNNKWRSGKYQAQIKINHGYGKALLGLQGIAYDKNFATEIANSAIDSSTFEGQKALGLIKQNQDGTLPNMDVFQTFQRNFVSSYILSQTSQFADVVADKMSPVINAVESNASANATFGTKGQEIIDYLEPAAKSNEALNSIVKSINPNEYYLVLSQDELDSVLTNGQKLDNGSFDKKTLLGTGGTMSRWLDEVQYFATSTGYASINADKSSSLKLLNNVIGNNSNQFISAIDYALAGTTGKKNDWDTIVSNLWKQLDVNLSELTTAPPFKTANGILPFLPSKVNGQDVNMFTLSSKLLMDNKQVFGPMLKPFTDMGMPMTINLLGTYWSAKQNIMSANGVDPSNLTKVETARGASMGIFGIGLGQMFILLGTFIGYSMLREALKRNKQYAKLTPRNWYLSKMLDYALIGFIQTTITAWIMYAAGWHKYISATAMTYEWIWLLMGTFVMMAVICGLQFAMDASLGSVLGIFYLAFNITCSGASYPGWMQSKFYWGISWLMPFTYLLEGSNQILYGINVGGGGHYTNMRLLELWGYSSCFFAFFFLIGLWGSGKQYKVSCYGSNNGAAVYAGLKKLDYVEAMVKFRHPYKDKKGRVKFKYNWDSLVGPFDPQLYKATKHAIKKRISFKWYENLREKRKLEEREIYGER